MGTYVQVIDGRMVINANHNTHILIHIWDIVSVENKTNVFKKTRKNKITLLD